MKLNKLMRDLSVLGFIVLLGSSCVYETLIVPETEVPDTVSHSLDIIPIYDASCNGSGCHNTGGIPPDLTADRAWFSTVFGGYVDTTNAEGSLLYTKIAPGGSMYQFATDNDRALILAWIEQGAQNN